MSESIFGTQCLPVDDIVCRISTWIWRIVPVICLIVGTFGNITSVIILLRKKLRSKPCFILIFVAVLDIVSLWSVFIGEALRFGYSIYSVDISVTLCSVLSTIGVNSIAISLWTIAIFTIGRVLFAYLPYRTNIHLNRDRSIVAFVVAAVCISTLIGITSYLFETEINGSSLKNITVENGSQNITSCFNFSYNTQSIVWVFEMITMFVCMLVPFFVLLLGNCALIFKLHNRPNHSSTDNSQIPFLFAITGLAVVTILPYGLFYLTLQIFHDQIDKSAPMVGLLHAIIENLGYCFFGMNFYCYLWKSSLFKAEFKEFAKEIKSKISRSE